MSTFKKYVLPGIVSLAIIAVLYYVTIPAINIQNVGFWWFCIWCIIIFAVAYAIAQGVEISTEFIEDLRTQGAGEVFKQHREKRKEAKGADGADGTGAKKGKKGKKGKRHGVFFWLVIVVVFLFLGIFVGNIASSPFFNARAYAGLLQTETGDFSADIGEVGMSNVPVVDKDTAVRLGSRTIGEMSDLVSQYAIDESYNAYTQISYKDAPYRVSPLVYADIIKWITNTGAGLPGYVTVNMATQETKLVRLDEGKYMHVSTAEHFNNYLYRYVRFAYPTEMFGDAAFEIDDDGAPYWIVPTVQMRIGLFGGKDYSGAILVNACTGEMQRYTIDEVPSWCDKVFSADLVYEQLGYYGCYQSGFWNSLIGQSGVTIPTGSSAPSLFSSSDSESQNTSSSSTSGYNYLAINDDVYMYTGMTSANSDESLVAFVLTNLRTKETKRYECAGATETSAMRSAEGQVQQMSYKATSPLLLNIANRPTYFLSLKDSAGLVKMYAFIDVQQYQIVGTGSTINDAQKNYVAALANNDEVNLDVAALSANEQIPKAEGVVESIQPVVTDGNTRWYFKLQGDASIYVAAISASSNLPFVKAGDALSVTYSEKNGVREVSALQ